MQWGYRSSSVLTSCVARTRRVLGQGKQAERSAMLIDAVREKYGLLQLSGSPEAVITGGTSGIGEGVAIRLAKAGANTLSHCALVSRYHPRSCVGALRWPA